MSRYSVIVALLGICACGLDSEEEADVFQDENTFIVDAPTETCGDGEAWTLQLSDDGTATGHCTAVDGEGADLWACLTSAHMFVFSTYQGSSVYVCLDKGGVEYCGRAYYWGNFWFYRASSGALCTN